MDDDCGLAWKNPWVDDEIVNHIRAQRHDFMNDMQVIWGYLQLGKPEEAGKYIVRMNSCMDLYSRIFYLGNPTLSLFLYDNINRAKKLGLSVEFSSDLERVGDGAFTSGYNEKLNLMECMFQELVEKSQETGSTIYIDIYSEDYNLYIVFANNPDCDNLDLLSGCSAGADERIQKAAVSARRIGIRSMFRMEGTNITAAICFEYKEDD